MKFYDPQLGRVYNHPYNIFVGEFGDMDSAGWSEELKEVNLWCWEAFGERGEIYDGPGVPHRWYQQKGQFWFRDDADVAWFTLKWL